MNFVLVNNKPKSYPDAKSIQIYMGMRTLLPACNRLVTAVAANDLAGITDIEEALVNLINDCCVKLRNTKNNKNGALPNPGLAPAQVAVNATLLPPGAPVLWGLATVIPNPGQLPQNPPVAIIPAAAPAQLVQVQMPNVGAPGGMVVQPGVNPAPA